MNTGFNVERIKELKKLFEELKEIYLLAKEVTDQHSPYKKGRNE